MLWWCCCYGGRLLEEAEDEYNFIRCTMSCVYKIKWNKPIRCFTAGASIRRVQRDVRNHARTVVAGGSQHIPQQRKLRQAIRHTPQRDLGEHADEEGAQLKQARTHLRGVPQHVWDDVKLAAHQRGGADTGAIDCSAVVKPREYIQRGGRVNCRRRCAIWLQGPHGGGACKRTPEQLCVGVGCNRHSQYVDDVDGVSCPCQPFRDWPDEIEPPLKDGHRAVCNANASKPINQVPNDVTSMLGASACTKEGGSPALCENTLQLAGPGARSHVHDCCPGALR